MPLVFPLLAMLRKLWGRPPGLRGTPSSRIWNKWVQRLAGCEQADGGVGRGPGGPPHDLCRRPAPEKTSGISLPSCPTIEHFYAVTVLVREHHTGSCLAHSTSRVTNKSGRLRLRVPGPIRLRGLPGCCR